MREGSPPPASAGAGSRAETHTRLGAKPRARSAGRARQMGMHEIAKFMDAIEASHRQPAREGFSKAALLRKMSLIAFQL